MTKRYEWEDAIIRAGTLGRLETAGVNGGLRIAHAINWAPTKDRKGKPGLYWDNATGFAAVGVSESSMKRAIKELKAKGFLYLYDGNLLVRLPDDLDEINDEYVAFRDDLVTGQNDPEGQIEPPEGQIDLAKGQIEPAEGQIEPPCSEDLCSEDVCSEGRTASAGASATRTLPSVVREEAKNNIGGSSNTLPNPAPKTSPSSNDSKKGSSSNASGIKGAGDKEAFYANMADGIPGVRLYYDSAVERGASPKQAFQSACRMVNRKAVAL